MTEFVRTTDGVRIAVEHHLPLVPTKTAVVVTHGFTAHRHHADVVHLAEALAADGHAVYTFDARGHGDSDGLCTLGDLERLDVAAVADLARREYERVVTVGASMGAVAVIAHAATHPDIAGTVAVSPPAVWRVPRSLSGIVSVPLTRTRLGQWLARRHMGVRMARRWTHPDPPARLVERVEAPLALVHGRRDRFIHHSASVQLHAHAPSRWRLDLVEDMAHAFDPAGVPSIRTAVAWVFQARETLSSLPDEPDLEQLGLRASDERSRG